jgi:hypothetical protein
MLPTPMRLERIAEWLSSRLGLLIGHRHLGPSCPGLFLLYKSSRVFDDLKL